MKKKNNHQGRHGEISERGDFFLLFFQDDDKNQEKEYYAADKRNLAIPNRQKANEFPAERQMFVKSVIFNYATDAAADQPSDNQRPKIFDQYF